ncbi:unnamed protein product [Symbiodinium pilosum]|uniref:Uncharacterized protein n=1 Tax=Symbiodinium pilosum TaxID=2952 RepID=A0A812RHD8_SYMPI|nr:unnamed protein product [Symbiodinium pilosum]
MLVARMCPASDKVRFFKGDNGKNFAMVQMRDEDGILAILGCAKEDDGFLCVQCWPSGQAPEGRKRKRATVDKTPKAEDAAVAATDEDKPLEEAVEDAAADKDDAAEEEVEDKPLEEVLGKDEGDEAPAQKREKTAAAAAVAAAVEEKIKPSTEDDESSVEQSMTVRLPVSHVSGEHEEEFLKKAAMAQMEAQEKGKGKGHGKGHGKPYKGGKDGKGRSKDGKGKSGKGGKAGKGKGSRKGGKH